MKFLKYITSIIFILNTINAFTQIQTYTYTYDPLNRLTKVQYGNGTTIEYSYDAVGNRESKIVNGTSTPQPDIAPLSSNLSVSSGQPNTPVTLTWTENNLGSAATTAAYNSVVVLSSDATYQAGTDVPLATQTVATAFAAGGSQAVSKTFTIPANTAAGTWYILIVSDANGAVAEISEQNNVQSLPFRVGANCAGFSVSLIQNNASFCGQNNGSVTAQPTTGFGPYTYQWSNGGTNGAISYQPPGTYSVTVTANNGCTATNTATIGEVPSPTPNFSVSLSSFAATFTNSSTNATSYSWNFGDGTTSTATNPSKTYANAGTYRVCLSATNASCPAVGYCQDVVIAGNGCDVPTSISSSSVSNTTATLSWNATSSASSYSLRYKIAGNATWTTVNSISGTSYNLSGLSAGSAYEYQVEAACVQGNSGYGISQYFTTTGLSTYGPYYKLYDYFPNNSYVPEHDFIKTTDNKLVMAGYTAANGLATPFIYKIDPNTGNTLFSKSYTFTTAGGYTYPIFNAKAINGKILSIMRTLYNDGNSTAYNILEINESGNITKNKSVQPTVPVPGNVLERQQIISNSNNTAYYYTGDYLNGHGSFNLVSKLDTNLNVIWSKRIGISANALSVKNVLATSDGGLLISLEWLVFQGFVGNDFVFRYRSNLFKLDSNGIMQWARQIYTDNTEQSILPRRVTPVETSTGFFLVYGSSAVTNNINNGDQVLIKFNKGNGDIIWKKYINGLSDISLLPNGSILLTTASDHQFARIDDDGNIIQNKKSIYNKLVYSVSVLSIDGGNYFVKGRSNITPTKEGFHLMKLDSTLSNCTTIPGNLVIQNVTSGISISPNYPLWETLPFGITISDQSNFNSLNLTGANIDECPAICNTTAVIAPLSTNTFCGNQTISLTSIGTGATNYAWYKDSLNTAPSATGATASISFSTSGIHKIYLVATNGDCSSNTSVNVTINEVPQFTVATTNEICNSDNGTAIVNMITSNQGNTIQWSNDATGISTSNLSAGTYQVIVTNTNQCSATQTFSITNTSNGFTIIDTVANISCFGLTDGSVKLGTPNAVAPITYNWSNTASTRTITNLAQNSYNVTVSDAAGCVQIKTYTITQPQNLYVNVSSIDATSCGGSNGIITANVIGGTPPMTYSWSNGQTTQTAINLAQNNYTVSVTDSKGCATRNTGTVGIQGRKGDVFYTNPTLSGISNVVLHRGQFALMIAKDPSSKFPGYPDTLSQFIKMDLINESGTLYNLETSASAAHPVHGNVAVTPDGKLSVVYQAPTGTSYGFKGMHRIYNCGSSLDLDEQVFTNANWGAWMRHIEETNRTRVISFAHGGYYVLHHKKENGGAWQTVSLGGGGSYLGGIQLAKKSDNSLWLSGRYGTTAVGSLRYYTSPDGTSYGYGEFPTTMISPSSNCDIKFTNTEQLSLLANQNDTLRLLTNTTGTSWSIENIVYQPTIEHRASLFYRTNGNTVLAYQTTDKLVVMEKTSGVWSVKYAHNNLIQSDQIGGSRAPSLLMKGSDLWVVYGDGQNVYKYDLDLPCDYVQLYAKVFLQGAYNSTTGLMNDNLRSGNLIPTNEPYTGLGFTNIGGGSEVMPTGVSSCVTGNDAIVDWVFLELRDGKAPTTKIATRCALVQRDGDIVDIDGISPITFKNIALNLEYYVVVKHRNHFGVMTALPMILTRDKNLTKIDFTNPSVVTWGTNAQKNVAGKMCLWAGDVNQDHLIKYNGSNNDKNVILSVVGLTTPNNIINAYHKADINLDGLVKYNGASNDKNVILSNVGLLTPNNILTEQIPN